MSESPTTVKRGQHKPDCKCGWCQQKLRNLEKKTADANAAAAKPGPAGNPSPPANASGESSVASSPPKPAAQPAATATPAKTIRAKVAQMSQRKASTVSHDKTKPAAATPANQPASANAPGSDWFKKLFSGPWTFFDKD